MKNCLCLLLVGTCLGFAQESATVDLAARRESVVTLKQRIDARQKRLDEVAGEIRDRSAKTDKKIEDLVKMLSGLKDSQDSKRRISDVKGEAAAGLKRLVEIYRTERRNTLARLAKDPAAEKEALSTDLAAMDKLAEKRIADIVELVKSMPGGTDVQKYENDGDTYYDNGTYYENSRISEAWRQNRRDKVETEKARREAQQALEKAIADLSGRRDTAKNAVNAAGLSDAEKEIRQQELANVEGMLQQRKAQLVEVSRPALTPEESASKNEADDLKSLLAEARSDIGSDVRKTLTLYREAVVERENIRDLRENLAAREKWLQENDPEAKKDK
ncbi:hypothetical protein [Haloferula sp. BvORR071]|uniref:hypothetical protein n=1 Tax=Haloferula sp. BvORR071 TaxID=1396141 RepID=UPI002240FA97|nr:hypothetical protein [Haloferula sp. BvORR071]